MTPILYTLGVVAFVVAILVSIGLHEFGHLVPAKKFGCKVPQWFIGFGPTVWSKQIGDTEYGIKAIPLGGYVKIVGMLPPGAQDLVEETTYDEDGEAVHKVRRSNTGMFTQLISDARAAEWEYVKQHDTDRLFYRLAWWKKVIVMAGGPMVNIAIATSLFAILFATYGNPRDQVIEPTVAVGPRLRHPRRGGRPGLHRGRPARPLRRRPASSPATRSSASTARPSATGTASRRRSAATPTATPSSRSAATASC